MSEFIEEAEDHGDGWEIVRRRKNDEGYSAAQRARDRSWSERWNSLPGGLAGEM